jgi:ABC-type multidrug transport system ATPase subunit
MARTQAGTLVKSIEANGPFGAIQAGFSFDVRIGYTAVLGANNSGKSTFLQWIYRDLMNDSTVGVEGVCYVEAERGFVSPTTEVQGQSIGGYNSGVAGVISGSTVLQYNTTRNPFPGDMTKYLLNHKNFRHQLDVMDGLLRELGLPPMVLQTSQTVYFEEVLAAYQGSGLRSLLPILASLSDPAMGVILIDEPETSLEPQLAGRLRRLLVASAADRAIIVASHSHLFINRDDMSST